MSDNTSVTALDALARDLLAVPENAGLFAEPGVLIVQMAARIPRPTGSPRNTTGVSHPLT
ncbi:hypothetical protein ACFYTS_35665 [Nocardia sp. NPDC004151]|uniref:hypothetical protein n=1 Tax=Nocardia sp. NPDC004151 TaxID=3364304 RepID=UPI0036CE1ECD